MTRRATLRGAERVARRRIGRRAHMRRQRAWRWPRELAGSGADVLLVDRYEVGDRATSACAARACGSRRWAWRLNPTRRSVHETRTARWATGFPGAGRLRLSRTLPTALRPDGRPSRSRRSSVAAMAGAGGSRPAQAPLMVDALGWRRVLGREPNQPRAPLSRGLEVHPDGGGRDLDVWIDRARPIRLRLERARGRRAARGRRSTSRVITCGARRWLAERGAGPGALPGKLVPASPPAGSSGRRVLRGRLGWALLPLSGEGIGRRSTSASPAAARLRSVLCGERTGRRHCGATRFSASHSRAFRLALRLQWLVRAPAAARAHARPALARQALVDRAFGLVPRPSTPTS